MDLLREETERGNNIIKYMTSSNLTNKSNWTNISKPIIGLAPMDGITDAAFREIADKYGKPDVLFTEFVPAEGIAHGATRLFRSLQRHPTKTPIVAQLFGKTPKAFYESAKIVCKLGFDGVDINMGCPDNNIYKKGGGAKLISEPALAQEIIKAAKQGVDGRVPVTVKTRTGIDKPITSEWISALLEAEPDAITLHGRTLAQMYRGHADWEQIALGASLAKGTKTKFLGNGDVESMQEAREKTKTYDVDGVLIGRAALGNPWIFGDHMPTQDERFAVMIEHCRYFIK